MNKDLGRDNPLWAVLRQQPTAADCQRCQVQLIDYAQSQLEGQDERVAFPWVAQHLDACLDCAQAYALVYEMLHAEQSSALAAPDPVLAPNLGFLRDEEALVNRLRRALDQTAQQITLQLDATLRALLAPPPTAALVRSGESGRYHPAILTLTPDQLPEADLPLALTAYADSQQPDRCLVEVNVQPPGQSWPDLGGRAVTLTVASGSHTTTTDDWGTAAFTGIPQIELDTMRLDVTLP